MWFCHSVGNNRMKRAVMGGLSVLYTTESLSWFPTNTCGYNKSKEIGLFFRFRGPQTTFPPKQYPPCKWCITYNTAIPIGCFKSLPLFHFILKNSVNPVTALQVSRDYRYNLHVQNRISRESHCSIAFDENARDSVRKSLRGGVIGISRKPSE